jgi:hypothetical protein
VPDFDFSELNELFVDLEKIPQGAVDNVRKATTKAAVEVKEGWRDRLAGSPTLPHAARSIRFDLYGGQAIRGDTISAEVAPKTGGKGQQGSLVWVAEFGSLGSAPRGYGRAALQDASDHYVEYLQTAVEDAQKAAGL